MNKDMSHQRLIAVFSLASIAVLITVYLGTSTDFRQPTGQSPQSGWGGPPTTSVSAESSRDMWAQLDDPGQDGWHSEVFHRQAAKQLKTLADGFILPHRLQAAETDSLVTPDFQCDKLLPDPLETVLHDRLLHVQRATAVGATEDDAKYLHAKYHGAEGFAEALGSLDEILREASDVRFRFKVFRVSLSGDTATTRQYLSFSGNTDAGMIEGHATWKIHWIRYPQDQAPRMRRIIVEDLELVRLLDPSGSLFRDCTSAVLGGTDCYKPQLLRGLNDWLPRSQQRRFLNGLGTPGLAIGDVNGDGLDDIYLCQEEGLPNRLFLHLSDGTVSEVAATWRADWLHESRSALLFDWDNDGDQDLAVAILGGIVLAENVEQKQFQFRTVLASCEDPMSLSAADYDMDGDLDLYVCGYYRAQSESDQHAGLPGAAANFVYHDANNGGKNALFQNEGSGDFKDVTAAVGMDQSNYRLSFAAAWEDYDNDGDLDLYVANDYGRDNFYRNDGGTFTEVAGEVQAEDSAGGMGITWSDYNHDGWMDAYVSNMWSSAGNRIAFQPQFKADAPPEVKQRLQRAARGNTLLAGNPDGRFEQVSGRAGVEVGRWAWGSHFVDLNNDAWDDLVVANGFVTTSDPGDL